MNDLPLEVIEYIAQQDNITWYIMIQVFRFLAEKAGNKEYIDDLKKKFLRKILHNNFKIAYGFPNGKLHTFDDPCVDNCDNKYWYRNGNIHRDNDLPALICISGNRFWYQNDKLHRDNDLPAIINNNGDQYWYQNDKLHRDNDLPAIISVNGNQYWYQNGQRYWP